MSEQPPSGGCVLKPIIGDISKSASLQPPSGGCVLKLPFRPEKAKSLSSHLRVAVC